MSENGEIFMTQEERGLDRLENILRHSVRRDEVPVMLVQLPNLAERPDPESPVTRRRATIVDTSATPQLDPEQDVDPVEWHFRRNTPDLRTSLLREAPVDELSSRRKSRVANTHMDQVVMMASNASLRYPIKLAVEETTDETRAFSTIRKKPDLEERSLKTKRPDVSERVSNTVTVLTDPGSDNDTVTPEVEEQIRKSPSAPLPGVETSRDGNQDDQDRGALSDDEMSLIDHLMYSMDFEKAKSDEIIACEEESANIKKSSPKGPNKGEPMNHSNEITIFPAQFSFSGQQSPFQEVGSEITVTIDPGKKLSSKKKRDEITVMPAQYSFTDQKSPFKKTRDEIRPRPSSRVRVFFMLDEWGEPTYYVEEEDGKRRLADGDGRRRDPYRDEDDINYYGSGKYPMKGAGKKKPKKGGPWDDGDLDQPQRVRKPGDKNRRKGSRGTRPGDRDYDDPRYGRGKDLTRLGKGWEDDDDDKGKRGKRPGDRGGRYDDDYDDKSKKGKHPGDRGGRYDDDGDDKSKKGKRPGDRGGRYDDDDDDKSKKGKRLGDRGYDDPKYRQGKDGTRPGKGWDDDDDIRQESRGGRDDDDVDDKKGRRTKDRKYGDGNRPRGKGRGKPGGDTDPMRYRLVTMPRSATMLTSRRRYHVQITDHEMKEPWFNSCFNISKENNVDFNYEGPVKITPYYVGDKFS